MRMRLCAELRATAIIICLSAMRIQNCAEQREAARSAAKLARNLRATL
jgi:hypothetical protein